MTKAKRKKQVISSVRPPVVSFLGHIDHGKTSLLDQIRKSKLASSEAGGITQHIGAYQIEFRGKKITFIDTPGHAAFAKMRARGAEVTDLAVLVVASDEGVKPQTRESLKYIKKAKIPFLVAANKIDLAKSKPEMVAEQLAKEGFPVEKKGGEIVLAPVSAKTGEGIEDLLEMILLVAEMKELKGDPQGEFVGVVIDSRLDRQQGSLATVLVKNGTLSVSDSIWAEGVKAKVKAMADENGRRVKSAGPSQPVEVLGFESVPLIGAKVSLFLSRAEAFKPEKEKLSSGKKEAEDKKKLKLILKADTQGTLEAIVLNLPEETEMVYQGVGDINESDVLLSQATGAKLIGFNIGIPGRVKKLAQFEKVKLKIFKIIYELLEDVQTDISKILKPAVNEEILGEAKILKEFLIDKKRIAGCQVLKGRIAVKDKLHLKRGEKILGDCRVVTIKQGKEGVEKAKSEEEFGVLLSPQLDFAAGDMLVSFRKLPQQ
jgi:translation initiation factor IF-2